MKKLIVFDLDGTLAESKSSLDTEISGLLHDLLGILKVVVISGGDWPQFDKQLLSKEHPRIIHNRSIHPVLNPLTPEERKGVVSNVVFPTGIDRRDDLGMPNRFEVYYGMADKRIGVARLDLPDILPPEGVADSPKEKV